MPVNEPDVLRKSWIVTARFVRVGYVRLLLIVDAAILALLVIDTIRLRRLGISPAAVITATPLRLPFAIGQTGLIAVFMLVVIPAILTFGRLLLSGGSRIHGKLAMEIGRVPVALHVLVAAILSVAGALVPTALMLSGLTYTAGSGWDFAFSSLYAHFAAVAGSMTPTIITLAGAVFGSPLIAWLATDAKPSAYVADFLSRLYLLDLRGDLYPSGYTPRRSNFMAGAISPGVRNAVRSAEAAVANYNGLGPGSPKATESLVSTAMECVEIIRRSVIANGADRCLNIAFTSNTTRALEIAICFAGPPDAIVLSPFEHPSEERVAEWLRRSHGVEVIIVPPLKSYFTERPAGRNAEEIAINIGAAVEQARGPNVAVLISDVCWSTGIRIPVDYIATELRAMCPQRRLTIIIDGAHAAGHNAMVTMPADADMYVFSGHKWLFSNEPVGVIVTREQWKAPYPVDVWVPAGDLVVPSIGTAGPVKLAHLRGALRMLEEHTFERFWERSRELRRRFVSALPSELKLLAFTDEHSAEHTFIVAVVPADGFAWFTSNAAALASHFEDRRISVNVLPLPHLPLAVRVTFPYFLSMRDLDTLRGALENAIRR